MQAPDYGTISVVDPDLAGDPPYTTLQGWYDDTWDEAAIQHAECYSGDEVGLGQLDTSAHTPSYQGELDADHPVCIYAADGHEQDGSRDNDNQGAAVVVSVIGTAGIWAGWGFFKISGLRVIIAAKSSYGIVAVHFAPFGLPARGVTVERCMIVHDRPSGHFPGDVTIGIVLAATGVIDECRVANNLILNRDSSFDCAGIHGLADGGATVSATMLANSIADCASFDVGGMSCRAIFAGDTVNATAVNNVIVHDGNQAGDCFAESGDGTVDWTGSSHNVSSDATAKGTDANTNAAIADVWTDIGDNDAPFTPKTSGELDPPDGANLYDDGVTVDALGVERPSFGAQYRGGLGIFAGLYKIYGGATPAMVDYATMLASVRAGSTSIDVAGLGLASGGTYYIGVRATSVAGVEEDNTDRLTRAVVNQSGQLQPLPLAAVEELTAELQTDGTVIVGFSHKTWPGWAGPTRFEVLSDNGTGELNLTTPAATIDVTDPGAGDYEVALDPPTLPAMFSARACSGADDGPIAPPVTVSPPAGPAAPQQI